MDLLTETTVGEMGHRTGQAAVIEKLVMNWKLKKLKRLLRVFSKSQMSRHYEEKEKSRYKLLGNAEVLVKKNADIRDRCDLFRRIEFS